MEWEKKTWLYQEALVHGILQILAVWSADDVEISILLSSKSNGMVSETHLLHLEDMLQTFLIFFDSCLQVLFFL